MPQRDFYEILGVTKQCSDDELKKAYRKLAVQYHPDRNSGDKGSEERFKEINEAYQILSDPKKRAAYDQFGMAGLSGAGGFDSGFGPSFVDIFDNIFGDIFGGRAEQGRGIDLRYDLEVTFEESANGCERKISFERETMCETCHGSGAKAGTQPKQCRTCRGRGQVQMHQGFFTLTRPCSTCGGRGSIVEDKCSNCRGRGHMKKPHSVVITVPAGIDSNQRLRVRGEGAIAEPTGKPGDLYVVIHVKEHPIFKREEEDVVMDLPLSFTQASLGCEIEVPTLHGKVALEVPSGIQSGELLRLKGKGIKRLNGSGHGDQHLRIFVETPTRLNAKQKELLRQFETEYHPESQPRVTTFIKKVRDLFKA